MTDLVDWSVQSGSESIISVSNDAGTRGLVQALAPGEATLLGSLRVRRQARSTSSTRIVVSNAALQRIVPVADRLQYAPGTTRERRGHRLLQRRYPRRPHLAGGLVQQRPWRAHGVERVGELGATRGPGAGPGLDPRELPGPGRDDRGDGGRGDPGRAGHLPSPPAGLDGSDLPVEATGVFSDGTAQSMTGSVQWSVDDQTVGYFGRPGVVSLLSPGSTIVRAVAGAVTVQAALDVAPAIPFQVEISPAWPDPLLVGSDLRLPAFATHQDGTVAPAQAAWSTTGPALAISPAGDLLAQSAGQSPVVATVGTLEARVGAESTADAGVGWLVWPPESIVAGGRRGDARPRAHPCRRDGPGPHPGCGVAGGRRRRGDGGRRDRRDRRHGASTAARGQGLAGGRASREVCRRLGAFARRQPHPGDCPTRRGVARLGAHPSRRRGALAGWDGPRRHPGCELERDARAGCWSPETVRAPGWSSEPTPG